MRKQTSKINQILPATIKSMNPIQQHPQIIELSVGILNMFVK